MTVHLAVTGDVFGGILFCASPFSRVMSWMRIGTELSQFLKIFPTYSFDIKRKEIEVFDAVYFKKCLSFFNFSKVL